MKVNINIINNTTDTNKMHPIYKEEVYPVEFDDVQDFTDEAKAKLEEVRKLEKWNKADELTYEIEPLDLLADGDIMELMDGLFQILCSDSNYDEDNIFDYDVVLTEQTIISDEIQTLIEKALYNGDASELPELSEATEFRDDTSIPPELIAYKIIK